MSRKKDCKKTVTAWNPSSIFYEAFFYPESLFDGVLIGGHKVHATISSTIKIQTDKPVICFPVSPAAGTGGDF